jgi:hypothetical protein
MLPDKTIMCPYTGFAKSCREGVTEHNCPKWIHIKGLDPQTGAELDKFGCADTMMHVIMLENTLMQRQTGAAVESLRNVILQRTASPAPPILPASAHRIDHG